MNDFTSELETAVQAAREAQKIIIDYRDNRELGIDFKGKNDLVTDADLEAEKAILEVIQDRFPDDRWLAEETAGETSLSENRTWLIDPIDGTTNFAHGFPVFCVSIALWQDRRARVAVMLEVSSDNIFTAIQGEGAALNGDDIEVSSITNPSNALIGTGFPYNDLSLVDDYMNYFRRLMDTTQGVRRPGSAAFDLCCVACGWFDGFYEYSLNAWDVASASLIVQEAGGVVTDWDGADDWLFGERIVAGNPTIHAFLLEEMKEVFSDENRAAV